MKKALSLSIMTILLLSVTNVNAKIRRVGYSGIQIAGKDYSTLQDAHLASLRDDTILLFPGAYSAIFSKKLHVIGYGYFINEARDSTKANPGLQTIVGPLTVNHVEMRTGSDSCTFEGIDGFSIKIYNSVSNITIKRCMVNVYLAGNLNNWTILQSYINSIYYDYNNTSRFTNLAIQNSYIAAFDISGSASAQSSGLFANNVIRNANFNNGSFSFVNNILLGVHDNDADCIYKYNIGNSSYQLSNSGNDSNNKNYTSSALNSDFFVGFDTQGSTSNDERWKLSSGSPAKGAGEGGVDCGMFGGSFPYKLSGIPSIPSFYRLDAPSSTADAGTYKITFSVRSNN